MARSERTNLLWRTHNAEGELQPEWKSPKTGWGLVAMVARHAAFLTGIGWILRGLISAWGGLLWCWIVPFCSWHIAAQYIRLICEHSVVESDEEEYSVTRTTLPTWLQSVHILPRNVGYHLEHHWYPSVPICRLPERHQLLTQREGLRERAMVRRSLMTSLRECIRP